MEILSQEDQELVVQVIQGAEASFEIGDPEYAYWWTGLRDLDDDGEWTWSASECCLSIIGWHDMIVTRW